MRAKGVSYSRAVTLGVFVCMFLVGHTAARADETDDLIKQILRETRSAAAAAKELVASAKGLADASAVQTRLCEKAYECGVAAPAGYASALAALDLLAKVAPARTAEWDGKRLKVYRLGYLRGDRKDKFINGGKYVEMLVGRAERCGKADDWPGAAKLYAVAHGVARTLKLPERPAIYERMREANNWIVVYSRLAGLKTAVEKNPDDTKNRKRLVEMYLIDLDTPHQAAKYLGDGLDAALRKNVSLAAREASELTDTDFLTLGQWYRSLATRTAARTAKARLLTRARDNLVMYLEVYTKKDLQHLRVAKTLKAIDAELKRLGADVTDRTATGRTLTLKLGKGVTMKLVRIPAGKFVMGSPATEKDRKKDEGPQRQVTISEPFYMGITEVTQAQYAAVTGKNPSKFTGAQNPVEQVSWDEAVAFCSKLSQKAGRQVGLPTEAEWEYACRVGSKTRFSFGDSDTKLGHYAWYNGNSGKRTHPVGAKKPNAWGLHDMHGNVWEWCADWYADSYANVDARDPKGPVTGSARVLRGGSWYSDPQRCRAANRNWLTPDRRFNNLGFRVVVLSGVGVD